jgi:tRNA uridine 5-carbamoylmethylation protein Kti12
MDFSRIDEWLADPNGSRIFLLTGDPGKGKTAIAARLVQMSKGQVADAVYRHTHGAGAHYTWVAAPFYPRGHRSYVDGCLNESTI